MTLKPDTQNAEHRRGKLTRRTLLSSAGAGAVGVGLGASAAWVRATHAAQPPRATLGNSRVSFYAPHQAGIVTPPQNYLQFAAFDFRSEALSDLRDLMSMWSAAAATLTAGRPLPGFHAQEAPTDSGEAIGLPPSSLTVTFGLGPTLFEQSGRDRLGLLARRPAELSPLPPFQGESLNPSRSGGDLCIQACADDPQVAFHAIHALARLASATATLRWLQGGFGRTSTTSRTQATPRNLLGFKDGTNNIQAEQSTAMDNYVWVPPSDRPSWMVGGSYLVVRRIRTLLDVWDATSLAEQERTIGRHKLTGAPLGSAHEYDAVNLDAQAGGAPIIPSDAHIRLASPQFNAGQRILRRGYSYSDGYDPATGQLDAGLFFIAFQRSATRQFIPIQKRLAANDALNHHTLHTASAIFAIPPGTTIGGYVGDTLF